MQNVLNDIREQLELIGAQAKRVIQYMMESDRGINDKVDFNTLIDSDIYNEIEVDVDDWGLIKILINDYVDAIEQGTPRLTWVDEQDLIPWARKRGIPTDNRTMYLISLSIFKYGISPRPFMDDAFTMIDTDYWSEWADNVFNILTENLDDYFNN